MLFGREEDEHGRASTHGNFHPAAYAAICEQEEWLRRLKKVHTASRRSRPRKEWQWMELDSAVSSDALLMNIFCHPGVFDGNRLASPIAALMNVDAEVELRFGSRPGVPLKTSGVRSKAAGEPLDRTEIDLSITSSSAALLVEAKLTESDFQTAATSLVERYRDLEAVFDVGRLPRKILAPPPLPENVDPDDPTVNLPSRVTRVRFASYQLIRNALAAYSAGASLCVLTDARRHDLIESWYAVLAAVHSPVFATRLKLLTWQELAGALPLDLQDYIGNKYGIGE